MMSSKAVLTTGMIGLAAMSSIARADLKIDLRFADGSKTLQATPGDLTPITINAWGVVNGATGNTKIEGLQSAVLSLQSQIVSSGITGSISAGARATGWGGVGSQAGSKSNLSADGIGDWGSNASASTSVPPAWFRSRTTKSTNNPVDWGNSDSPVGSTFHTLANGGREFLIGTFVFTPTAMPSGSSLKYNPGVPVPGGLLAGATWFEDTIDVTDSTPNGGHTPSTGTYGAARFAGASRLAGDTVVLPEPTSLGLMGLAGLAMLRRSRK